MSETVIKVEGLGKLYRIGARQEDYKTLRDTITDTFISPFRKIGRAAKRKDSKGDSMLSALSSQLSADTIWALKDVSFEVKRGEVVGIIGRNGAGKSTLLKILSRITEPTEGYAEIRGRVGSLLEVGTGFHPELSGRENIYLNGAILGMKKAEIERKFDEIVAFAEVEKFIDTPVKHYSSGMYVRLAFAVAAHLEPEILLVDEVLAVGDARFQRKCLNKMQDVGLQGRTVLFVSHNMPAITRLCPRTVLLDSGKVLRDGLSHQVVSAYLGSGLGTTAAREWPDLGKAPGNDIVRLHAVRVRTEDGRISDAIDIRHPVGIEMEFEVVKPGHILVPNYHFFNEEGVYVFVASDHDPAWYRHPRPVGHYVSTAWIPGNFLAEGSLIVGAAISTMNPVTVHFYERDAVAFQVIDSMDGDSARGDYAGHIPGVVRPLLRWTTEFSPRSQKISDVPTKETVL
jgi:lipopolysaccharide transport system ATP-binding protein